MKKKRKLSSLFDHWIYELEITTLSKQNLIPFYKEKLTKVIKKNIREYDMVFENEGKIYVVLEFIGTVVNAEKVLIRLTKILENRFADEVLIKSNHIELEGMDFYLLTKITESKDYTKSDEQTAFLKMICVMASCKACKNNKRT